MKLPKEYSENYKQKLELEQLEPSPCGREEVIFMSCYFYTDIENDDIRTYDWWRNGSKGCEEVAANNKDIQNYLNLFMV